MKYILTGCLIIALLSCNTGKDHASVSKSDTTVNSPDDLLPPQTTHSQKGYLDLPDYSISVQEQSYSIDGDDYLKDGNFLFVYNKSTGKKDSVLLETTDDLEGVSIEDLTDSLHFDGLSLLLTWSGDSDMEFNEFVQYVKDTLKTVFTAVELVSLTRKDKWTLEGFRADRDEILYNFQLDYPVIISLETGDVQMIEPPVQYLGAPTTALGDIKAYKMNGRNDSSAYTIKKGAKLTVDTFYRASNIVQLITEDSLILHAKPEALHEKVATNNAG